MRLDQLVDHLSDLGDRQRRAGIGVEHHSLVDMITPLLERSPHRQLCDVHERAVERRTLRRQRADRDRMHPVAVDPAWDLDAAALRQVVDQTVVANVPVLQAPLACDERVDVARRELALVFDRELCARREPAARLLILVQVLEGASDVLVDRDPVALELFLVRHEPRHVLGAVLA